MADRLTADIAHELNNPTTAVRRGLARLAEALEAWGALERRLGALDLDGDDAVAALGERARAAAAAPRRLDALDRSDAEDAIEEWLDDHGVERPYERAPVLVELGYDAASLDELADRLDDGAVAPVLAWLAATHEVHTLLAETRQGANRIADIVENLRTRDVPDPAPPRTIDVHDALDEALVILRGKLEHGIEVRREYADDLPPVRTRGSVLSQVWTNLIDNAIYAMDGEGKLTLRTRVRDGHVEVEVEDEGPGIPEEARDRIFDAFFTTKPPGEGTGLGLDISRDIVVNRHGGELDFTSEPGRTTFIVRLPVDG